MPIIAADVSRTLSRAGRSTPTGIDRVEIAYARHLAATGAEVCFAAMRPTGGLGLLPDDAAREFVAATAAEWRGDGGAAKPARSAERIARGLRLRLLASREQALTRRLRDRTGAVYLLVSHHHLENDALLARVKASSGARFVCLIHDLIPVQFPEYAKPGQAANHLRRVRNATRFADALIVNSAVTLDALQGQLDIAGRSPPVLVAPFGIDLPAAPAGGEPPLPRPYFVYVSTIEARKNHLLLLNVWRRLAAELGDAAPLLVLIGQRGWETENVVDMLERCPALRSAVIEHNALSDSAMVRLLCGARAVLLPSFAEGFGFPVIEALALGVPALCSDIPALRETGGGIPEFFDPLDGLGWRAAILDYAAPESPRRAAQLARLAGWRPPCWQDHFAIIERFIAEVAAAPPIP
ncbi:MAG TPA: glycosyltransferase family 1 protein [Stellaceae bacterium]|nr:glycosyltransferase family 1 protein [Stellaceae bacterium]